MAQTTDTSCTLFVHGLPKEATTHEVLSAFAECGPIKRCHIIKENGVSKGLGYVTFALNSDALATLNKTISVGGQPLKLKLEKDNGVSRMAAFTRGPKRKELLKEKLDFIKQKRRGRIIIRNLSFKADENVLKEVFSKFGELTDITIPKKEDGSIKGFAFISYPNRNWATKAINEMNGKKILGRVVALDHSLPKKEYDGVSHHIPQPAKDSSSHSSKTSKNIDGQSDDEEDQDQDQDEDESEDDEEQGSKMELEDNDQDEDEEDGSDIDQDDEEDDDANSISTTTSSVRKKERMRKSRDAREGKTVFLKNLPFDTTQELLKEFMEQFGPTEYCVLCIDRDYGHPKGTGFVKFKEKDHCEECLKKFTKKRDAFLMNGRRFEVCLAVTRGKVDELCEKKKLKARDKRNIYLAKEGLIYPDSPAAEDVSQSDLAKRLQLEMRKRIMLNNLLNFVSRNRLCIHNLPEHYTDNKLKKLCLGVLDDSSARITEAKVMRNVKKSGLGKSAGFGFVTFSRHVHALQALRRLNNNPEIFTPNQRPIVEFSIEKVSAVKKKRKNQDFHYEENAQFDDGIIDDEDLPFMGVQSKPFREDERIVLPKVNRKIYENLQKLKERGKKLHKEAKSRKVKKEIRKAKLKSRR